MQTYLRMGEQVRTDPNLYRASKESHFETALVHGHQRDMASPRDPTKAKAKRQAKKVARKKQR